MVKPIATIHEDTLILEILINAGVVGKETVKIARKIVRRSSDYKKLKYERHKPREAKRAP